jgi:enamine deaminase RidA (YjgF/YER057c/UK114 family)
VSRVEAKLKDLGLTLPPPMQVPGGVALPFPWVNVRGDRAFVSGHRPQNADGSLAGPFGKVGAEVTLEQGNEIARKVGLSILGSLQRELGDLDRIAGWARVFGMVNSAPGFDRHPAVINGFSDLILGVFGPEIGRHARSAIGVAGLPFNIAVEIEAEVLLHA